MNVKLGNLVPLLAVVAICLPGITSASDTYQVDPSTSYDGWEGFAYGMICTGTHCNDESGCSWLTSQYDTYYPQLRCESGGSGQSQCLQTYQLCRETKKYDTVYFGCSGEVITWTKNYYGACGQ